MLKKDIVVIGGSAGGLPALKEFVKSFSPDFFGYIFVVLHIPPFCETKLALILSKVGPLKAVIPKDGEEIKKGIIYVAKNDHHLLLEKGKVIVVRGPKENGLRPSIDALFRSAAYIYGPKVIGIVLSGCLADGTSGLWFIHRMGGVTIIQEPEDALFSEMPKSVLEYVKVDYCLPARDMANVVESLVDEKHLKKDTFL